MKPTDHSAFIKLHNEYRTAVGLPDLAWDEDLATAAEAWAQKQVDESPVMAPNHAPSSVRQAGENLYFGIAFSANELDQEWANAVVQWGSEKEAFDAKIKKWKDQGKDPETEFKNSGFDPMIGHYTQIVWKDTTKVGCGLAYKNTTYQGHPAIYYVVAARYLKTGNMRGILPYDLNKVTPAAVPQHPELHILPTDGTEVQGKVEDQIVYTLNATEHTQYFIWADSKHFDLILNVNGVRTDTPMDQAALGTAEYYRFDPPQAGAYPISIEGPQGASGSYTFIVRAQKETHIPTDGRPVTATLQDSLIFYFNATAGTTYNITFSTNEDDLFLLINTVPWAKGSRIWTATGYQWEEVYPVKASQSGTYYLEVIMSEVVWDPSGLPPASYTLKVEAQEPLSIKTEPLSITTDGVSVAFKLQDSPNIYAFNTTEGTKYTITADPEGFDIALNVNGVEWDARVHDVQEVLTFIAHETGKCLIRIRDYDGGSTGGYTLKVEAQKVEGLAPVSITTDGQSVTAKLQDFRNVYEFNTTQGTSYIVTAFSNDFDLVLNVNGVEWDKSPTSDSEVLKFIAPETGKCQIRIRDLYGSTSGSYTLKVEWW